MLRKFRILIGMFFFLSACGVYSCRNHSAKSPDDNLFTLVPSSVTHADFINHLDYDRQLKSKFNIYTYRNFYNGGGVALGDVNNDGLLDVFLASNMGTNVLYLNKGNFQFEDISAKAGIQGKGNWSTGVSFADVNGDGLLDIYVCKSGNSKEEDRQNELFINNGDLTFTEKAREYRINNNGYSTQAIFFDYDKDGDLDMYLLNNSSRAISSFKMDQNLRYTRDSLGGDKLYRNDGSRFADVSAEAGIYGSIIGFGLGVSVTDINKDGWPDIYVSNDFFERDYLYLNNHDGTFTENLEAMIPSISAASMGADVADINNDGYPDIFATDMVPEHNDRIKTKTTFDSWESYRDNFKNGYYHQFTRNMLQLNNTDGTFSEIGRMAGVNATDWSWGALIMDLDNDGLKDLFVANGIFKDLTDQDYLQYFSNRDMIMSIVSGNKVDYKTLIDAIPSVKISNYAFKNEGNYIFRNKAAEWGLGTPGFHNGSAYGDLDNDGDLDLVVNNVNEKVSVYRNETTTKLPENHFLKIILKGDGGNTAAFGTSMTGFRQGKILYLEQMPIRGFLSTSDPRPNFGLGTLTSLDSLRVEWPDGRLTLLKNVAADQTLTLYQKDATRLSEQGPASLQGNLPFRNLTGENKIDFVHKEDDFNDFERDNLLYHMLSTEGPRMCIGDVNSDGLEDFYIGGAKGEAGALMIQNRNGSFTPVCRKLFEADKISEDTDCAMFDADGDGDTDLYVASGSNEFPESSSALADRLYINDGKGNFTRSKQVLPAGKYESTSCVRPCDFDNDGIVELFVGIRMKPFLYGAPVNGYILENDGKGNFVDVTAKIAPGLKNLGMIRDMQWADFDGDGDQDMVIAGDWMPLKIFVNDNGIFKEEKDAFGPEKTEGWWNCITIGDFNSDGKPDFIAGNLGLNSKFHASPEKPVEMYVNDFDLNGTVEQIICTYDGDRSFPLALRHDLIKQIPALAVKYPTYQSYKDQQITDIFTPEQLKNAIHLKAEQLATSFFINDGNCHFTRKTLPAEAQFSPVYAALAGDFNNDGNQDVLLGGNLYNVKPEIGRYDASWGCFLAGDGKGNFSYVPAMSSGFRVRGEIRDFKKIRTPKGDLLLVARSNDRLMVFSTEAR
jgi:hypothetical protein